MQRKLKQSGEKIKGPTTCLFSLDNKAQIVNVQIEKSSGSPTTDSLAISALQKYASFKPYPDNKPYKNRLSYEIFDNRVTFSTKEN
jgi:outer membrane biosynthesis protein TonB